MKVKLFIIGIISAFMFGCLPQQIVKPDPIVVKLKIEGVDTVKVAPESDKVVRSMEVPNETGELNSTFIDGDVAYMKIWSTITSTDAAYLWNDFTILKKRGIKKVIMYISSGGGSAFGGLNMADQLEIAERKGINIECHAAGIIASATVPIFAVCSQRYAAPGTIFMVHEASLFKFFANETKSDIRSQNELMELLTNRYMDKLAANSNLTREEWIAKEKETTWFCVDTAKKWGLVDEIE